MMKVSIIVGEFHKTEAEQMVQAASEEITGAGGQISKIVWVPGSYEIPYALKVELDTGASGVVLLGIIERGETAHGIVMANAVTRKVLDLQEKYAVPIGFGILGPEIFPSQIQTRVVPYARAAANAVIKLHALK